MLEAYTRGEGLDDPALAGAGLPGGGLAHAAALPAPRVDGPGFREDIDAICERFGINPDRLCVVVKRGRVIARMQAAGAEGGFLMAARDRQEGEEESTP